MNKLMLTLVRERMLVNAIITIIYPFCTIFIIFANFVILLVYIVILINFIRILFLKQNDKIYSKQAQVIPIVSL